MFFVLFGNIFPWTYLIPNDGYHRKRVQLS